MLACGRGWRSCFLDVVGVFGCGGGCCAVVVVGCGPGRRGCGFDRVRGRVVLLADVVNVVFVDIVVGVVSVVDDDGGADVGVDEYEGEGENDAEASDEY